MKKLYVLFTVFIAAFSAQAQNDTLIWQNFENTVWNTFNIPNGVLNDTAWYNWDNDGESDFNSRPQEWAIYWAVADPDRYATPGDSNFVLGSSSWHDAVAQADNWFVTKAIQIVDNQAVLKFKSATLQTPYFLDGFKVKLSTNTNDLLDFTTTLFTASQYVSGNSSNGANYAAYTFSPASGAWIQGWNGTAMVPAEVDTNISTFSTPAIDSARFEGRLTEHTINLGAYSGQTIYIAFQHDSFDDNLLTIDDILLTGTQPNSVEEHAFNVGIKVYPNPATDYVQLNFNLSNQSDVTIEMYDVLGRHMSTQQMGNVMGEQNYRLNVAGLAPGTYNLYVKTEHGTANASFVKQ